MLTALYPERRCGPKRRGGSGYGRGLLVLLAAFTASLVWTGAASAAPTCQDLSVTTPFQTPVTVTLVCMDPDYPVSYSIPPAETRVSLAGDKATFTPPPGAAGQTSFTYFGYNSIGATAIGTVRVTILPPPLPPPSPGPPPNRPPAAHCDSYSVKPGEVVDLPTPGVLANDSDPDGDRLRIEQADDIDGRFPSPLINHNGALRFEVPTKVRMLSYRYVATDGALHSESSVTFWIGTKDRGCRPAFDPPPTSEPNLTWTLLKAGGAVRIRVGGS
jgi:hypothetical protein